MESLAPTWPQVEREAMWCVWGGSAGAAPVVVSQPGLGPNPQEGLSPVLEFWGQAEATGVKVRFFFFMFNFYLFIFSY